MNEQAILEMRQMIRSYIFSTDAMLRITAWGEDIAGFTGRPSSSVIGHKYYEIFPMICSGCEDAATEVLKTGTPFHSREYGFNCLAGEIIRAEVSIEPEKSADRLAAGVEITISPLCTCPAAEKLESLQSLIDIGKTATTLAHGVRNPLNAIKGAVVYLRGKYENDPTLVEFTKIMEEEIGRLDSFISKFLSTTVMGSEAAVIDINELLRKVEVFTSFQSQARNIRLNYRYCEIPPIKVEADPFELEQAVLNVINNAIDAMHSRGELTVKAGIQILDGSDFAVIQVSDTGRGMDEPDIKGFSKPLKKEKGKGYGLFITREALQHYGGHLEIKSREEGGTDVRLFLPLKKK